MGAIVVEPVEDDAALEAWVEIRSEVLPWWPMDVESARHARNRSRERVELLAREDGAVVAGGVAAVLDMVGDPTVCFANVFVPAARRCAGIGTTVLTTIGTHVRAWGRTRLEAVVSETDPDGLAFARNRGYEEVARAWDAALPLADVTPAPVDPPPGVEISTLSERPDLMRSLYEVECEAIADIPAPEPYVVGDFDDWRRREVEAPLTRTDLWFLAIADGEVVGHALLLQQAVRPGVGWHEMTGVRRDWRGRGVAGALKRAQIAWAKAEGLDRLETENHEDNAPMRRLNERLGYQAKPATITLRGPLPD